MKTKTASRFLLGLAVLSVVLLNCSRGNSGTTNARFSQYADHGFQIGVLSAPMPTNCYPIRFFAGTGIGGEYDNYIQRYHNHTLIPETLPVEQDPDGNWGQPVNDFQLSLRFRHARFPKGGPVPALMILRNLSSTNSPRWWRNALPDHGFQFTLHHGTKVLHWMRPQNPPPPNGDWGEIVSNTDPYLCQIMPHVEELTVIDLKQLFDLKRLGKYSTQVQLCMPTSDGKVETNLVSGTATFELVEK